MNNDTKLIEALNSIDVSTLTYDDWLAVGFALKEEGYDVSVWREWSRNDKRFVAEEFDKKWATFNGSSHPVTGGTIIKLARDHGYTTPTFKDKTLEWNDTIEYDGSDYTLEPKKTLSPIEQLIAYLSTLFENDEIVGYVTGDVYQNKDGKWVPSKGVYDRTAGELIESLKKHPEDIGYTIGDTKPECGAWIRFNPLDGSGVKNENVTSFKYALVESDSIPVTEQDALYRRLELPIAALVYSGGKSLHAIVRIDAENYEEYTKRVDFLFEFLKKSGLPVDRANRNPSRLSRMPGVMRNGVMQTLIATNAGRKSWVDWLDYAEGISDELPDLTYLSDTINNPPALPEPLIEGILRCGHKMLISGSSKAGKSFLLMELCIALAEGTKWLGFQCKKSKVLYVNLEIDSSSCINRFVDIYKALKLEPKNTDNIVIWNLRGHAIPLDRLVPKLIRRITNQGYGAVIIDPIYKVITGDENNASDMGAFCNQFDKICNETGCAAIYCHHHSKGVQGFKKAMDRASGSGVFARDPDAQLDMIQLNTDEDFIAENADDMGSTAWRLESSLREFPNIKPRNFWFIHPIHVLDEGGLLEKVRAEGDPACNLEKSGKRKQTPESRRDEFEKAYKIVCAGADNCTVDDLAEYLEVTPRTVEKRVVEFGEDYYSSKGKIYRKSSK